MNTKDLPRIAIVKRKTVEVDYDFSWDQKKAVVRENNLVTRKIKEIKEVFYLRWYEHYLRPCLETLPS